MRAKAILRSGIRRRVQCSARHTYLPGRCRQALVHNGCVSSEEVTTRTDTAAQAHLALWVHAMAACVGASPEVAQQQRAHAERALGQLYDHSVRQVHALVRRFVHEDSAAQEVTEDVFYQAWLQSPRFDAARGNVMAWLLTMARSRALDAWRKHSAQRVSFDSEAADDVLAHTAVAATPFDLLAELDAQHAVHAALAEVSPMARQMISLAFFQGLTQQEISTHLHLPLGTVKTTLRRALISLREHLQTGLQDPMHTDLAVED